MEMLKQNLCSVCQKVAGICNCAGCQAFFCTEDFMKHRQWLSGEFEQVIEDRNHLQEIVNDKKQIENLQTSLLSRIDQWQKITIEKVRYVTEKTRQQVIQLLNDKIKDIETEFGNVTKQLRDFQGMSNFVENDLDYLKDKMQTLEKSFRQITELPSVKLREEHSEQIEWTSIIYVDDKCAHDDKTTVSCLLADANCTWTGPYDQLDNHLLTCSSGSIQSKLRKLNDANKQLKKWIDTNELDIQHLKQRDAEINGYETEIQRLGEQVKKQKVQIDRIKERLKQRNIQMNQQKDEILSLKEQLVQTSVQIDANKTQLIEIKQIKQQQQQQILIDIKEAEIKQTREQLKQRQYQIGINETQISQLKEETKHQKMQIDSQKAEIRQLKDRLKQWEVPISMDLDVTRWLRGQLSQKTGQINANVIEINRLKEEIKWQKMTIDDYEFQNRHTGERARQSEADIQQLKMQLQYRGIEIDLIKAELKEKKSHEWYYRRFNENITCHEIHNRVVEWKCLLQSKQDI